MLVLKVDGVSKSFGQEKVLDDVKIEVEEGEKVVLFGHNGSGKTTLLRCVMGLEVQDKGEILVLGMSNKNGKFQEVKKKIGYVPQQPPLWAVDVEDLVNLVSRVKEVDEEEISRMCEEFELDLKAISKKKMTELSGGMRQKLLLSFALAGEPKLLVLDEPFSNLDVQSQQKLFKILSKHTATQVISTHRIEDVSFATQVVWMVQGKVVFKGNPKEFTQKLKEKFAE